MSTDPFSDPAPAGGKWPSLKQLKGRLLLITPLAIEKVPNTLSKTPGAMTDRITADVVFLDGDPIKGILDKDDEVSHTYDEPLIAPTLMNNRFISGVRLVPRLSKALSTQGMVLGRLVLLPKIGDKSRVWDLEAASEDDKKIARAYLESTKVDPDDPFASA